MKKDLKRILDKLEADGYTWSITKNGHVKVYFDGEWITTFAGSASDWRSLMNALAPLKRRGFRWPPSG